MLAAAFLILAIVAWFFAIYTRGLIERERTIAFIRSSVICLVLFLLTELFFVPAFYPPEVIAEEEIVKVTPYGDDEIRIQTEEGNEYTVSYDTAMKEKLDLEHPEQQKILVKKEVVPKWLSISRINKFSYEFEDIEKK